MSYCDYATAIRYGPEFTVGPKPFAASDRNRADVVWVGDGEGKLRVVKVGIGCGVAHYWRRLPTDVASEDSPGSEGRDRLFSAGEDGTLKFWEWTKDSIQPAEPEIVNELADRSCRWKPQQAVGSPS